MMMIDEMMMPAAARPLRPSSAPHRPPCVPRAHASLLGCGQSSWKQHATELAISGLAPVRNVTVNSELPRQ